MIIGEHFYKYVVAVAIVIACSLGLRGQIVFSNVAGVSLDESDILYNKDGGCSFADYDLDGDLDLVVNTYDDDVARRSYLLRNDNGIFTDVTNSVAPGLKSDLRTERTAAWGDFNSDGFPDLIVNTNNRLKILQNNAGTSFSLHTNTTSITNGMNVEGLGWLDYDNDGDLDYFVENDTHGIDLFENDGSTPNPVFTQITVDAVGAVGTGSGGTGLPEGGSTDGDYASSVDLNNDGYVDIIARRRNDGTNDGADNNPYDIFLNDGDGTFTALTTFNEYGNNADKGSAISGDFDNDGDFDILWTSGTTVGSLPVIYENTGTNSLSFVAVSNPFVLDGGGLYTFTDSDGAAIGDIDHDGDLDLFITRNSGTSHLFLNTSTGAGNFSFRQPGPTWITGAAINYGIDISGNGEGCVFVDYDNDGDVDLYVNKSNAANQLWQNDYVGSSTESAATYQNSYLRIMPLVDLGNGIERSALNATVTFLDCDANPIGGIREIGSGGAGHGSQSSPWIIFGLPDGPDESYSVRVQFTRNGTTPVIVERTIVPSQLPDVSIGESTLVMEQTLMVRDSDASDPTACVDTDNDGITDLIDLDDDNDGILDTDECLVANLNMIEYSDRSSQILSPSDDPTTATISGGTLSDSGGIFHYVAPESSTSYTISFDVPVSRVHLHLGSINDASEIGNFTLVLEDGSTLNNVNFLLSHDPSVDVLGGLALEAASNSNFTGRLVKKQGSPFASGVHFVDDGPTGSQNWGILLFEGYQANPIVSLSYEINTGNSNHFVGIVAQPQLSCDTDGDGIVDHFDLDSDGDGCLDVTEAGYTDDNDDGILGPSPVTVNGSGQVTSGSDGYTGTSSLVTDVSMVPPGCGDDIDSDGITDQVDLDDDNDGLFDSEECENDNVSIASVSTTVPLLLGTTVNSLIDGMSGTGVPDINIDSSTPYPWDFEFTLTSESDVSSIGFWNNGGGATGLYIEKYDLIFLDGMGDQIESFSGLSLVDSFDEQSAHFPLVQDVSIVIVRIIASVGVEPEFNEVTFGICDTDGDNLSDNTDIDSDGDGCTDVTEAGFTDDNDDGELGPSPVTVNGTGEVTSGSDGYTGTSPIVQDNTMISASCDTDGDGVSPLFDIDDDNDGISDIDECDAPASWEVTSGSGASLSNIATLTTSSSSASLSVSTTSGVVTGTPATDLITFTENVNRTITVTSDQPLTEFRIFFESIYNTGTDTTYIGNFQIETWGGAIITPAPFENQPGDLGFTLNFASLTTPMAVTEIGGVQYIYDDTNSAGNNQVYGYLEFNDLMGYVSQDNALRSLSFDVIAGPSANAAFGLNASIYLDTDSDGVANCLDLDSDNDGIYDVVEGGDGTSDVNGDGAINSGDTGYSDGDSDGMDDTSETTSVNDSDSDGNIDSIELDSDNDGCNDVIEAGYSDPDNNGLLGSGN